MKLMRYAWLLLWMLGCRCSADVGTPVTRDEDALDVSSDEVPVEPNADAGTPGDAGAPAQVSRDLCFSFVDPELEELFPGIRERVVDAGARWGWPVRFDDSCLSTIEIVEPGELREYPTGRPIAVMRLRGPGNLGLAYEGSWSVLVFNRERLDRLIDGDVWDCFADARETERDGVDTRKQVLSYIIAHELGHAVLKNPDWHSDDTGSLMAYKAVRCYDADPTDEEIAATVRPAAH